MENTISDEEIHQILYNCWEDIACFITRTEGELWAWKNRY